MEPELLNESERALCINCGHVVRCRVTRLYDWIRWHCTECGRMCDEEFIDHEYDD